MSDATQRERCQCGAEFEVGERGIFATSPQITDWRVFHARGCDLMFACLEGYDQVRARTGKAEEVASG